MIIPKYLNPGSLIGIVSPGGQIAEEKIKNAVGIIESKGYNVKLGNYVLNKSGYFAGTDKERTKDFQYLLDNKDVDTILCSRGGYGTIRIIDNLDFTLFKKHPKLIVGFSDITVLHSYLNNQLGYESLHATMPTNFPAMGTETKSLASLFKALRGENIDQKLKSHALNKFGETEGIIIGGNISVLYGLRGSKFDFNPSGKILFLEDIGENLYHLDRMFMNFKLSGIFDKISGLIIGAFNEMKDSENSFANSAYEVISSNLKDYNFPVIYDFPAGHIKNNQALHLGRNAQMLVNEKNATIKY